MKENSFALDEALAALMEVSPPVRKPVMCVVCEEPGTRGSMCDGCKALWLEGRPAA